MLSVDLFTGIGGFVLGLDGVCKPIVYCDNSPLVLRTLDRLMLEGAVPKATVVNDVTNLKDILRAVGSRKVDVVTAGFPCVGFSDFGRKEGLGDARSGLFRDAMKVVTALRPKLVFFENVHRIVNSNRGRDFKVIIDTLHEAGYDCRWTTCKASDVGIPMKRKRWFCLCIRRGVGDVSAMKVETDSRKSVRRPMPKLLEKRAPDYAERYSLLGNSIVPAVARFAFERLISGEVGVPSRTPTLHGFCVNGKVRWVKVKSAPEPAYEIILDPRHYAPAYTPKNIPNRATPVESQQTPGECVRRRESIDTQLADSESDCASSQQLAVGQEHPRPAHGRTLREQGAGRTSAQGDSGEHREPGVRGMADGFP
jgi:hypothetical protein